MTFRDDLDTVPWADLGHAYGPATDTPGALLALLSKNARTRRNALDTLWPSICHQGSLYSASAPAVPFLIRALDEGPAAGRAEILALLDGLSSRDMYARRGTRSLYIKRWPMEEVSPDHQEHAWFSAGEFIARGRPMYDPVMMHQAHAAAREGIPVYLRLIGAPDTPVDVLRATLRLLAAFREADEPLIPAFEAVLDEAPHGRAADPSVEAEALFGLGALLLPDAPGWERYTRLLATANPAARPAARYAAAVALATYHPAALPEEGVETLIEAMLTPDELDALPVHFGDGRISVRHEAYQSLGKLGAARGGDALAGALARGAERWQVLNTLLVAEALLDTAFFGMPVDGYYRSVTRDYPAGGVLPRLSDDMDFFYGMSLGSWAQAHSPDVDFSGYVEEEAERIRQRVARAGAAGLSEDERRALEAVVACEPLWQVSHNLMAIYGLPTGRDELRALLRSPAGGWRR